MKNWRRALPALGFFLLAYPALARVVSYAPVTSRYAVPAIQRRTNRFYLLFETSRFAYSQFTLSSGSVVLYDSTGAKEPRSLFDKPVAVSVMAVREDGNGTSVIFLGTDADLSGDNPTKKHRFLLSTDAGVSWKIVPLPDGSQWDTFAGLFMIQQSVGSFEQDTGGPFAGGRRAAVRIGTKDTPFVYLTKKADVVAIGSLGNVRTLVNGTDTTGGGGSVPVYYSPHPSGDLSGSNLDGSRFLYTGLPKTQGIVPNSYGLYLVDPASSESTLVTKLPTSQTLVEGWIGTGGVVYMESANAATAGPFGFGAPVTNRAVGIVNGGVYREIASSASTGLTLFAVPTRDFSGAWIVQRGTGQPTKLSLHRPDTGLVDEWRDVTAPEVEALHTARGTDAHEDALLLVQVHRPRQMADQRLFKDPALALWKEGDPAPRRYDELFLMELGTKGFVHLDVDAAAKGDPFVFDSGAPIGANPAAGGPSGGGAGGGADVTQEWGVVRASLRQKLVIPAVARTSGERGSFWRTEVLLQNPDADPLDVSLRFLPSGEVTPAVVYEKTLTLAPREVRVIPDVLDALFSLPMGSGALLITPAGDRSLDATSRTYTSDAKGTYGTGVGAVDVLTAFTPNFPATFAAALQGPDFRTNLVSTNVAPRISEVALELASDAANPDGTKLSLTTPGFGQIQLSGLGAVFGVPVWGTGALRFAPMTGEAIPALFAIDNRTNDPTYFPPDLPSSVVRTIPALVHADGVGGARFRSDLFLYNPSSQVQAITLAAKLWTDTGNESLVTFSLLPKESKLIRDALRALFGFTGVARLRLQSGASDPTTSVRVTSRAYTIDASGGTYGNIVPPLNSFQAAAAGDTLEILGPKGGATFRTNLALVELSQSSFVVGNDGHPLPGPRARIEILDQTGTTLDTFDVNLSFAGGVQIDDLFRARGLGDGPPAALIRISPTSGVVGAYATIVDRGTNDPTYFPANLAAR